MDNTKFVRIIHFQYSIFDSDRNPIITTGVNNFITILKLDSNETITEFPKDSLTTSNQSIPYEAAVLALYKML